MPCVICATPPMNDKIEFFLGGGRPHPTEEGDPPVQPQSRRRLRRLYLSAFGAFAEGTRLLPSIFNKFTPMNSCDVFL